MAVGTKKQVARKAAAELPQLGNFNFNRYRIQVGEDPKSKRPRYISPLDLAREAEELHRSQVRADSRLDAFVTHMFQLASTCSNPDEFRDVCQQIRDETGWGRRSPAPRIWIVYQSTIYTFWKKHKVRPLAEVNAPILENGRLAFDGKGELQKQKVQVTTIHQLKTVDRALKMVKRSRQEVSDTGGHQVQELVSKAQAAASDPELVRAIKYVVWSFTHLDRDNQRALISSLNRLLKEYPVSEPFPAL